LKEHLIEAFRTCFIDAAQASVSQIQFLDLDLDLDQYGGSLAITSLKQPHGSMDPIGSLDLLMKSEIWVKVCHLKFASQDIHVFCDRV
jgi:hypothetical protein